jgi:hypothetical protein
VQQVMAVHGEASAGTQEAGFPYRHPERAVGQRLGDKHRATRRVLKGENALAHLGAQHEASLEPGQLGQRDGLTQGLGGFDAVQAVLATGVPGEARVTPDVTAFLRGVFGR